MEQNSELSTFHQPPTTVPGGHTFSPVRAQQKAVHPSQHGNFQ